MLIIWQKNMKIGLDQLAGPKSQKYFHQKNIITQIFHLYLCQIKRHFLSVSTRQPNQLYFGPVDTILNFNLNIPSARPKGFFCFGRNRNRPKQSCFFSAETDTETENVFMFRPKPNLQYPSYQFKRGVCGTSWQLKMPRKHFQKTPCIILLDFCNKCYFLIEDTYLKY